MIEHLQIDSKHLAGNLLGDPARRDVFVYVPPGLRAGDRCPAVYLLHAFGETAGELVYPPASIVRWKPPLVDVLNPVFGRMGCRPMIVVVPDGWTSYGCSQWVDSPVHGNFEQYVTGEVVAAIDERYPTIPGPDGRCIMGFSSGGLGAWHLGSLYAGVFGALAMLSGDCYFDMTHKAVPYAYFSSIWPNEPAGPVEGNDMSMMTYALAAAYSPNPDRPPYYVDLPVDYSTGELIEEAWDRWLRFDPVVNCGARLANLRTLRGILLEAGSNDNFHLQWGHRVLSHRLGLSGIAHNRQENAGNHGGRSLESIQKALLWFSTMGRDA